MISNFSRLLAFLFIFNFISISNSFSQERRGVEMPKLISPVKSITNFKGWEINDIGGWNEFNLFQKGQVIINIEVFRVRYENKDYLCVAAFKKSAYSKAGIKHIEHSAYFWILDTTKIEDVDYSDTSVHTRVYENIFFSNVIGKPLPVTHNDLLFELKRCFIGTSTSKSNFKDKFFIKYRYDYRFGKAQFFIGSFIDFKAEVSDNDKESKDEYEFTDFTGPSPFGEGVCKDENRNLDCRYFEVPKNSFDNFFKSILK